MDKNSDLYCLWADAGLALHNSGRALLCCHSRTYLKDNNGQDIYWHTHDLQDAWSSTTRLEIQQALSRGHRHQNCKACWDEEDAGRPSRRIEHNRINHHINSLPHGPKVLDLKLGNTCNLACRHCWPEVSSKWINDYYEISVRPTGISKQDYLRRWDSIQLSYDRENLRLWDKLRQWITDVEYVDIFGAEPMLLSRLFDILGYCVDTGISIKQSLHINTNATVWNQDYINTLTKFQQVQIDLSIDGIGPHFDYIRYGETWDTAEKNIQRYLDLQRHCPNIRIAICITVCSLNVLYIGRMLEYFNQLKIPAFINLVHIPEYLNIRCLPDTVKTQVVGNLQASYNINSFERELLNQLMNFIQLPHDRSPDHWLDFCDKTRRIDQLRSQDYRTTFPEMWNLVSSDWIER